MMIVRKAIYCRMKNALFISSVFIWMLNLTVQTCYSQIDFQSSLMSIPRTSKFTDSGYYVWCGSLVKGKDGTYYLFYSRWPQSEGFKGWVTHSEVAIASSDQVTGPFKPLKTILPRRGKQYWDGDVTHNPNIHPFDGKYYLYYMGNYGDGEWWSHRNHQRIGVAVADDPMGPWVRQDTPVLNVSRGAWDHLMTSNPSVCRGPDGRYLLMYKGVGEGEMPFGGRVLHGVAFSDSPTGPFHKHPKPIFEREGVKFPAEDPFVWYSNDRYWAIVKDMHSVFIGTDTSSVLNNVSTNPDSLAKLFEHRSSLVLFESKNGTDWSLSRHALVSYNALKWKDGSVQHVQLLDRPQLYIEDGMPKALLCAVKVSDTETFNVSIPLK